MVKRWRFKRKKKLLFFGNWAVRSPQEHGSVQYVEMATRCFHLQNGGRNANTTAWVGVRDLKRWIVVTVGSHGCSYRETASTTVVFSSDAVVSNDCCRLQTRRHRSHEPHGSIPFRSFPFTFLLSAIFSSFCTALFHLLLVFFYCDRSREPCGTTSLVATAPSSL